MSVASVTSAKGHAAVDALETLLRDHAVLGSTEATHHWLPGLYVREFFMPAGSLVTSKIHRTEHAYVVLKGSALVWVEGEGWRVLRSGTLGRTLPGTRRVLRIVDDCTWLTFHPTGRTTVEEIEADIIEPWTPAIAPGATPTAEIPPATAES